MVYQDYRVVWDAGNIGIESIYLFEVANCDFNFKITKCDLKIRKRPVPKKTPIGFAGKMMLTLSASSIIGLSSYTGTKVCA